MSESSAPQVMALDNGLSVIASCRPHGKVFAAALTYRVGTFDDPTGSPGIAHFAEHLAFVGANKEIAARLSEYGGHVNAYTAYEHTEFQVTGHVDHLNLALSLFSNILTNQPVHDNHLPSEREIFAHELADVGDATGRQSALDIFWRRALGDPHWRLDQQKWSLKRMNRLTTERLNDFRRKYYDRSNARLAVVAPVRSHELRELLRQQTFVECRSEASVSIEPAARNPALPPVTFSLDRHSYVWLDVLHVTPSTAPTVRLAADMIAHLVGGGPNSEMFRYLRTERSIAYSAYADHWSYLNTTAVHFFCSVPRRRVLEALGFVLDRLHRIRSEGFTADELEREKARMIRGHELGMDNPWGMASYLAYEALRPPSESLLDDEGYIGRVSRLSLADANQAAAELLATQNRAVFIGGRAGPFTRFRIRRRLKAD